MSPFQPGSKAIRWLTPTAAVASVLPLPGSIQRMGRRARLPATNHIGFCFLKRTSGKAPPQLTWREVSRTSFGGGCWPNRNELTSDQIKPFDRLQQRRKQIGLIGTPTDAPDELFPWESACRNGNGAACTTLGDRYKDGVRVAKDFHRSAFFYKQGCDAGNALGCSQLGVLYAEGDGVLQDYYRTAELCLKGCRGGSAIGCSCLAYLYLHGRGGLEPNAFLAAKLYKKGCTGGDAIGCYFLGDMYFGGHGIPADHEKSRAFYSQSCQLGYHWGCDALKGF